MYDNPVLFVYFLDTNSHRSFPQGRVNDCSGKPTASDNEARTWNGKRVKTPK